MNPELAHHLLDQARALHRQGEAEAAAALYRLLVPAFPLNASLRRLRGLAEHDLGRPAAAGAWFADALALEPASAATAVELGQAHLAAGRLADAVAWLARGLAGAPDDPAAAGALAEAATASADLERRLGRTERAGRAARLALALAPAHAGAWRVTAAASLARGAEGGVPAARRAVILDGEDAAAWTTLAATALALGRGASAERAAARALALAPALGEALNNRAVALLSSRHPERAARCLERAARLAGGALEDGGTASNRLLALNYLPSIGDEALAEAHRRWGAARAAAAARRPPPARHDGPVRRLGYVSPNLNRHPVGYFLAGVLEAHDRHRFQAICYSDTERADDLTERLARAADGWRDCRGLADEAVDALIRRDGIDILIDLAGHTAGNRLGVFAGKPAPCQASWLGYFHTTGLPTIDAVLTDADSVPPEFHGWFAERVVFLEEGRLCYAPPAEAPPPLPPPLLTGRGPMFGSFNNLGKLTDEVLDLWARLLGRIEGARLTLKWHSLGEAETRDALARAFARRGVGSERLVLAGASGHADHLAAYQAIDVALDPFPFNGCLTTLEALWMGVPVVTLAGRRPVARQSLAILRRIGEEDLIARTPAEVIAIARALVADPAGLTQRRARLRPRVAARLADAPAFTRALERALERLWQETGS